MSKSEPNWVKSETQKNFDFELGNLIMEKRLEMKLKRSDIINELNYLKEGCTIPSIDYYGRVERGEKSISLFKFLVIIDILNNKIKEYNIKNDTRIQEIKLEQCLKLIRGNNNEYNK